MGVFSVKVAFRDADRVGKAPGGAWVRVARREFVRGGFFYFQSAPNRYNTRMGKLEKQLDTFLRQKPRLGKGVYIARGASVLGAVKLGAHSSVWYGAVLRGDINRIVVGHHSNIQDNAVLHLADDYACILGNYVTVGHSAIVHACQVGDEVLIGMGAVILDGAVIGKQSLIGAKALVKQGMKIPPGSLVLGAPAKVVRKLSPAERAGLKYWATKYVATGAYCLQHGINVGGPLPT
jgi:carbonic anhydrase/acetyltransferase-like protein (isoleucine patch superfamily)